ncbi:MAG: hypothetical protein JF617_01085, partial [Burkholderiales bacterium]|nr:hypothetical protein [Burkholderiales bacterium]
MKQLAGLDASFLYLETPQMPMHVGALHLLELPVGAAARSAPAPHRNAAGPVQPGLDRRRPRPRRAHRRDPLARRQRHGRAGGPGRRAAPGAAGPQPAAVEVPRLHRHRVRPRGPAPRRPLHAAAPRRRRRPGRCRAGPGHPRPEPRAAQHRSHRCARQEARPARHRRHAARGRVPAVEADRQAGPFPAQRGQHPRRHGGQV